jgi:cobalt-zinc-cadmium efflux system membrane fusion protein
MPPLLREQAGVRTEPVRRRVITPAIELVGSVEFNGDHVADVGSRVSGRVARVLVPLGARVRAGDPIAQIESAAVGEVVAEFIAAQAHATTARAESVRLATLARQQLATAREVEQNRAELAQHEAEVQSASQRLLAMGLTEAEVRQLVRDPRLFQVTLRAPIDGRVVARPAQLGQVVDATATLFRIADPARLWVQLELFERDLARVRVGDPAEILSETYPGRVFHGTIEHVAATVSHETRTARVRIAVANDDAALRPGQFVTARVRPSTERGHEALMLPRTAIVQLEGRPAAFIDAGDGSFEARTLDLGPADGDEFEIRHGVSEGEPVAVAGVFSLKSELLR